MAEGAISEPLVGGWVSVDKQNPFPLDHVEDTFRGVGSHPIEKRIPVLCRTPASETKPRAVQGAEVEPARLYFSAVMRRGARRSGQCCKGLGEDRRRGVWTGVRRHAGQDRHGSVSMEPAVKLEQRKRANKIIMKCSQTSEAKK